MARPDNIFLSGQVLRGVAVIGSTTIDCNISESGSHSRLGGVTTYAGLTYRRLGLAARVVTRVAACHLPLLARLSAAGIRIDAEASEFTTHFVNRLREGIRTQEMPCRAAPIQSVQVRQVLDAVDCIHLGPLHPADVEAKAFHLLRTWPGRVMLDVQGLVRRVGSGRIDAGACDALPAALAAADILKADADEIATVLAALGGDLAGVMARFDIQEVVVTDRERGGEVFGRRGQRYAYPPTPVVREEDPTGAGDVFLAAYAAARLADGLDIAPACACAARTAACHVEGGHIPREMLDLGDADAGCHRPAPSAD